MRDFIDITLPLSGDLPAWPGSSGFALQQTKSLTSGDEANETRLETNVHFGTHIDAPLHFIEDGCPVDRLALNVMIGPAVVAWLPNCPAVTAAELEMLRLPGGTRRLLLHTDNSRLWADEEKTFCTNFVALTEDGAQWVVDHGIDLIGIDYLSVQPLSDEPGVHRILLENDTIILEGLNLNAVEAGCYELVCLPLRLVGAEGAPARAVLIKVSNQNSGEG
jgi:arylformamidase